MAVLLTTRWPSLVLGGYGRLRHEVMEDGALPEALRLQVAAVNDSHVTITELWESRGRSRPIGACGDRCHDGGPREDGHEVDLGRVRAVKPNGRQADSPFRVRDALAQYLRARTRGPPPPIHHGTAAAVAVAETLEREPFMDHTGGPKLLLDRRAATPAPPAAPPPASPPRRGPRSGWRRASLSGGTSPLKDNRPPALAVQTAGSLSASTWIICVLAQTPTYGKRSRP